MNLNHIQTVAKYESKIFAKLALLEAGGIPVPDDMRGIPVQRLIEHPGIPTHEEVFIQISESCIGRALRTPEWTYCVEAPLNSSQKQELLLLTGWEWH